MKNLITFISYISFLVLLLVCGTIVLALYPETIILKTIVSVIAIIIIMAAAITMIIIKCNTSTDPIYREGDGI
mgnify:CR=1 FL=1